MIYNKEIIKQLNDVDIDVNLLIIHSFLGYKYLKHNNQLYEIDATGPTQLIRMYYELKPTDISFDEMKSAFVNRYILNESKLEGVRDDEHGKEEKDGFKKMYEYIHSDEIEDMFDIYTLKDLHKKLFSCTEFPEYGGDFRNGIAYLRGTRTELTDYTMIRPCLNELDKEVQEIRKYGCEVKYLGDVSMMLDYLDKCVELNAKIIKVHPFFDGNGRTVRGFTNKLLEDVGLPPIYIKASEKDEYHSAMSKAINEEDYSSLKGFYRYKICDSIIELDINDSVRRKNKKQKENTIEVVKQKKI